MHTAQAKPRSLVQIVLTGLLLPFFINVPFCLSLVGSASAGTTLKRYYAHRTAEDEHGVITPWSKGWNGPLDTRLRIAVEVLKRYPWIDTDKAVTAAPDFVYNSHWSVKDDGAILIPPTNDWMCGDLGQRAWSIIRGLTSYYQYSGDPIAFVYIPLTVDYILDYAQSVRVKDHYLGSFRLASGKHTVRFECVGRNPFSKGRHLGLDSVRLRERWNRKRKHLTSLPSLPQAGLKRPTS